MAVGKFMRSTGMAALAAGLALLALPASANAQDRGRGHRGDGDAAGVQRGGGDRGWRGNGDRHGFRGDRAAPAPQARVREQPQRNWSRGDGDHRGRRANNEDRASWRGRGDGQPAARFSPAPRSDRQAERHTWSGSDERRGRNRSYVDPNRNGTYRDRDRDNARRRDGVATWRNDSHRRDNDRWRGDRQRFARNWNRDWRGDSRYDWRSYRNSHRGLYRMHPYYAPYRNYSYRRLGVGIFLEPLFFGSRYWIDDPWYYRLPPADGPYRWIRYYDDALLVDIYTGEVVDVIYDFFW